ncbi:MAG: ABC transporter substrate-binding protein, partial [Desulfobacterales bacterium]
TYSGETFQVLPQTESAVHTVTVISQLIKPGSETIDFHYKLRPLGAKWQIVDIQIAGVSQLAMTRSQFVSIIKREGFAALISKLQNKIEIFSSGADR